MEGNKHFTQLIISASLLEQENEALRSEIKGMIEVRDGMECEINELRENNKKLEKENKEAKDSIEEMKKTIEIQETYNTNLLKKIEELRGLTCFRAVCKNRQAQKSAAVVEDGNGNGIAEQDTKYDGGESGQETMI